MSSTDYNYDAESQFYPFFVATVAGIITIPLTYSAFKPSKEAVNTAPRIQSDFRPDEADVIEKQRRKQRRAERKLKRMIASFAGWAVIAVMIYLMFNTSRTAIKVWDPYEVLGLSHNSDEKAIKSHYRRLSITQHPDKRRPDPAKNETEQDINDHWVEITKAFKTLTDEDIRRNYELYGHPDGKQSFSIGIALPQFLVTEGNGKYVLLFYGAILGVLLPYLVGSWWYGTQRMTKENILLSTSGKLFKEYKEDLNSSSVVGVLSSGDEFAETRGGSKASSGLSTVEKNVLSETSGLKLSGEDRKKIQDMDDETRRKTLSLLWAYLGRIDLGDSTLNEEKFEAAAIAQNLNEAYLTMLPTWGNAQPLLSAYNTTKGLIQAIAPGGSPLLQLPHFTPDIAQSVEESSGVKGITVQAFMDLPEAERRKLVVGPGLLSEDKYKTAMSTASRLPFAKIEKAFFKVTGEKHITPGSLIQLVIKLRIIPPGTSNVPDVNEKDLEDIDPKEGDLDALHGRKADKPVQPPLAYAPYFPRDHAPSWRAFLSEPRSGKIAVPPFKFQTFDKQVFKDDGVTPTFNVVTLKAQFQAPPQAAEYPFRLHFICDSYLGFDAAQDIIMKVEDVSQAEDIEDEGEISEPDEDSLAGQMQALKGGEAKPKRIKREAEDDDDESGTDEEEDSESDTDTDTDTDEE